MDKKRDINASREYIDIPLRSRLFRLTDDSRAGFGQNRVFGNLLFQGTQHVLRGGILILHDVAEISLGHGSEIPVGILGTPIQAGQVVEVLAFTGSHFFNQAVVVEAGEIFAFLTLLG